MKQITMRKLGGSVGASIPKEMLQRFNIEAGDQVLAIETEDGILLTPYSEAVHRAIDVGIQAAKRHRDALRELAK